MTTHAKIMTIEVAGCLILAVAAGMAGGEVRVPNRFEREIIRFEERDAEDPPPKGGVVFTGSSSIKYWETLQQDFPGIDVVNRGFGGAQFSDVIHYLDRIVVPYRPRMIVIYAGSHDLHREGGGPEQVLNKLKELRAAVREKLPDTRIGYLAMKPSILKWNNIHPDRAANRLIAEYAETQPDLDFIDIWTPMVAEGMPPPERYFKPDLNHPGAEAYTLWAEVIRPYIEPRPNAEN